MNTLTLENTSFESLEVRESQETNGGGFILPFVGGVVLALVVNEVVERSTGKGIVTHIGNGLSTAGKYIENVGNKIWK